MGMMLAAVQQGATLEQVEKMMDLQERWAKAEAKKAYDEAFANFKAEAVKIIKGKDVTDGPLRGKAYAELHDVVNAVTPALSKHGLSSSWKLTRDEKDWMEVTCYLRHVGGHEESVSMGGPPDNGGAKNAIQARASTKTYLERYTLKAITGLSEQKDDNDGNGAAHAAEDLRDEWISKLAQAETLDEAATVWQDGCKAIEQTNNLAAFAAFKTAYSDKRNMLKQETK
ncbi:ERF family protein [Achromobacter denitrificans]|nr:ERF family protein [Achromobacter denitrificans]QKH54018.1 ERF family protein [Achromobacter denitrificans]